MRIFRRVRDAYRMLTEEPHFPAAWEGVLARADSKHKRNLNQQINDFFAPDGISPLAFSANMAALTTVRPPGQPTEQCPPTASVALSGPSAAFVGNADSGLIARETAPIGYPTWFLAAYPDVALWMNRKVHENDDQAILHALGDSAGLDPKGNVKPEFLRGLIGVYQKETRQRLECAEYSPEDVKHNRQLSRARSLEHWKEAVRVSYKEHVQRARQEGRSASESHQIGLYGALASRYLTRTLADSWGRPHFAYTKEHEQRVAQKKELLWAELVPFLLMSQPDALEALVEYAVVHHEWPEYAREDWLCSVIDDALRTLPRANDSIRSYAVLALQRYEDDISWTFLIDDDVRETLMEALSQKRSEAAEENHVRLGRQSSAVCASCGHDYRFHFKTGDCFVKGCGCKNGGRT